MAVPVTMRSGRPRVLLVDDRPENLLALTSVLEGLDAELIQARSGTEALRRLLNEDFALIVLDVQMPTLDGFETARLIKRRQRTRHIPIVFLTAISGEPEHYLRGYSAGAIDYVHKPFSPEVLRAKVSVLLELWHRGAVIERQRAELEVRLAELDRANERLARQAVELERSNAALERFAEVAAHELRQPLRNVAGFVELWLARQRTASGEDDEAVLLAERAAHGVDELRALTDSLLAYAKTGTELRREPVPLAQALEAAERELAAVLEAAGATVEAEILPTVAGDRRLLVQLFTNLLDNAVKFAPAGADVRINARLVEVAPAAHGGAPREGRLFGRPRSPLPPRSPQSGPAKHRCVVVEVANPGPTIPPDEQPRIFELFYSGAEGRERGGIGLGLPIAREIVRAHGGDLTTVSEAGLTTFRVLLPAASAETSS
jgi:signal transduction histidine kinase